MVVLIIEALIVIMTACLFSKKYFNRDSFSESILTCSVFIFGQIVLVELILGLFGRLRSVEALITYALIFIAAIIFCYDRKTKYFTRLNADFFFRSNLLLFAFSVLLPFFLVKVYINLINPPVCPDGLQQHLAFPAAWIIGGNLDAPFQIFGANPFLNPQGFETSSGSYYPVNVQLFFTWLMLPLRNAFLADIGEAPFYLIGMVAVYAILRKYSVDRKPALLSSFLWALIPNIFKQLRNGSQIDIACAVSFLLVFYALLLLKQKFNFRNSIFFGITLGLFVGSKVINLNWLVALVPLICYFLYQVTSNTKPSLLKTAGLLSSVILMAVLFGGYSYIKNYLFTGNPLFPYDVNIFGRLIFKGIISNTDYKMQVAAWNFNIYRILFREGLGIQFLTLILPGTLIPLVFCGYFKKRFKPLIEYLLLFTVPLLMLVFYKLSINIYTVRYLYPYLSMGLLTAVIFITRFQYGGKYLAFVAFVSILAASFELANGPELVVSLLLAIAFFPVLVIYKKKLLAFYNSGAFSRFTVTTLIFTTLLLTYLNYNYDKDEFKRYPSVFRKKEAWQVDTGRGWKALNELTAKGARVAYTGRQEFYPLYGERLKNYVTYVSVNEKKVTPYNKPDGLYRRAKDFKAWMENLKKEKIEFLYVSQPYFNNRESQDPKAFPVEDEWAKASPDNFKLLYSNSMTHIYRVSLSKD